MIISQIDLFPITFKLKNPFTIAYDSYDTAQNLVVRLETKSGLVGWGNAAPDPQVTGETIETSQKVLSTEIIPAVMGRDARARAEIFESCQQKAIHAPAARAAIDMALYDLLGQRAGLPLYQLLGFARPQILTSMTLGIASIEENVRQAQEFVKAGFRALKIKTGLDWKEDVERVKAIRVVAGSEIALRVDANQGYHVQQALDFIRSVESCRIEFLEQPTPAKNLNDLKLIRASSKIPIMADESALSSEDIFNLAAHGFADMVNLKLMKNGGITGAMQATAVAAAGKLPVMLGCNDESRISIAAAVHLACALPGVQYADLDGAFDIVDDVAAGGFELKDGYIIPSNKPGLGVKLKI
jgi:L-alanine-DL-glutamate epimerase-like enolase superfamily enzyme